MWKEIHLKVRKYEMVSPTKMEKSLALTSDSYKTRQETHPSYHQQPLPRWMLIEPPRNILPLGDP